MPKMLLRPQIRPGLLGWGKHTQLDKLLFWIEWGRFAELKKLEGRKRREDKERGVREEKEEEKRKEKEGREKRAFTNFP